MAAAAAELRRRLAQAHAQAAAAHMTAEEALAMIALWRHTGEDPGAELEAVAASLDVGATPEHLPALFGLLEDSDPHGVLWPVLYVAEDQGDAYLTGLVEALPGLAVRAPTWAETAVLRILNTRGEPDDCTEVFEAAVRAATEGTRQVVVEMLDRLVTQWHEGAADGLTLEQVEGIGHTRAAVAPQ